MVSARRQPLFVCDSKALEEGGYRRLEVDYAGESATIIVLRYQGDCFAYLNRCAHMPRELDCERATVFDESGRYLRCSMHGVVYDPCTGKSESDICLGQALTPILLIETATGLWIVDKKVRSDHD